INTIFKTDVDKEDTRIKATGVLFKMMKAEDCEEFDDFRQFVFLALESNKVDMAMDLIYGLEPKNLRTPKYIDEGLIWLENKILGVDELAQGEANEVC
ncbi:ATP-dependent endonuclease, partial [Acinetobacter baumannii]|nr:ATP-dependent endonuclease [Acinetobacter baumannii]